MIYINVFNSAIFLALNFYLLSLSVQIMWMVSIRTVS